MFNRLVLYGWHQFDYVELNFHPRITVLTGANGSGKTTILSLLGRHFGWQINYADLAELIETSSMPLKERTDLRQEWAEALREIAVLFQQQFQARPGTPPSQNAVGRLDYTDGQTAVIVQQAAAPQQAGALAWVQIQPQRAVEGLYLPAHRSVGGYQQVQAIPARFNPSAQILESFINETRNRYLGQVSQPGRTPLYWMKEALIAAALYGEGNTSVTPDPEAQAVFDGFQAVLRKLLPQSLGFQRIYIRSAEVIVATSSGDFAIEAVSGGLSAIMELAWQVFLRSRNANRFVVLLDEPENHLHPELQRLILPQLMLAFPEIQFIVSTHSPFVASSVQDAAVYAMRFGEGGLVQASQLDLVERAGSANQVLRDVLGMDTTVPVWAEQRLAEIIARYSAIPLTQHTLESLRSELLELGLESSTPIAIDKVFERTQQPGDSTQ